MHEEAHLALPDLAVRQEVPFGQRRRFLVATAGESDLPEERHLLRERRGVALRLRRIPVGGRPLVPEDLPLRFVKTRGPGSAASGSLTGTGGRGVRSQREGGHEGEARHDHERGRPRHRQDRVAPLPR